LLVKEIVDVGDVYVTSHRLPG